MKGSEGSSPISHLIVEALEGENATTYKQIYNVSLKNGPNPECLVSLMPPLPLYSIITPLTSFKYHVFENIMENGAFAPKEHTLHFP